MAARTAAATGSATAPPASRSSPSSAAPATGGAVSGTSRAAGAMSATPSRMRSQNPRFSRAEHPTAEDDVRVAAREVETSDHRAGHHDHLIGETVDDATRGTVAGCGGGEDDR